jgi:predicted alpha/beta-fold hydrolase
MPSTFPTFNPHPLFRGGHTQTLAGVFLRGESFDERAVKHEVALEDGDRVVLHDDVPADWHGGGRVVLLIHGLAGCHTSPYMQRIARRLNARGMRTLRMDLRGCGAGVALARHSYHSGRSEDAAAALRRIEQLCPGSPVTLVGFSLGGNITLKLLGEAPDLVPTNLERALAVCPPVDLLECVGALRRGVNRLYDRYFTRLLLEQVVARQAVVRDVIVPPGWPGPPQNGSLPDAKGRLSAETGRTGVKHRRPRGIFEFDDQFTAPIAGFGTAENYYRQCSSAQFISAIRVPTLILAANNDPLVPGSAFGRLKFPPCVALHLTGDGGHLGFLARSNGDPDRRWMDWRVVDWCCAGD